MPTSRVPSALALCLVGSSIRQAEEIWEIWEIWGHHTQLIVPTRPRSVDARAGDQPASRQLEPLSRLIVSASKRGQVFGVTHSDALAGCLNGATVHALQKHDGATSIT